jgi:hypothetical protein
MPHSTESAKANVLEPKSPDEATPMRNPVTHLHIVGAMISGVILVVLAFIVVTVS